MSAAVLSLHTSSQVLVAYVAPTLRLSFQTSGGYDAFKIKSKKENVLTKIEQQLGLAVNT